MIPYLQRLLDRAAVLPARTAGADPLMLSGSPILAFDQRLASAEMADDFSILGATPDLPEAAGETPLSPQPLARQYAPGPLAPPALTTAEPRAEPPSPAAPKRPAGLGAPGSAAAGVGETPETHDADPVLPRRSPETEAVEPPRQPAPLRLEPKLPPAPPVSVQADPGRTSVPFRAPADPSPAPAEAGPGPMAPEARLPDPAPRTEAAPPGAQPETAEAQPVPPMSPPVEETASPVRAPAPAEAGPAAEPVVAAIPPLAPPLRGLTAAEVERMIGEAIEAERGRSAAREPAPARTRQSQQRGPVGEKSERRPSTAAQASLIGSLEASRFRPMLFGVRRR